MDCVEQPSLGRREANKQERRQAIVEIAKRTFFENGYAGSSMSAIAADLGGSKGTLWSYFPSKEDLFAAVLDDATLTFRTQLTDVLSTKGSLADTVKGFCRSFIAKMASHEGMSLHRLVVAESGRSPEVGQIFIARGPQPVRRLLANYFATMMDEGVFRRDNPDHVASVLISLCMGDLYLRMLWEGSAGDDQEIEDEAEYVSGVFLRAFESR